MSPIDLACFYGHHNVVSLLIDSEAKYNPTKKGVCSPLMYAIRGVQPDCVELLLKCKANVNHSDGKETPLIAAVKSNDDRIIDLILKSNPNPNTPDKDGKDPIYFSVETSNVNLFNKLSANEKIDIAKKYKDGQNLLHLACQTCCHPIITALFEKNFQPDQQDDNGNTPLHYAVNNYKEEVKEEKQKIIIELIQKGCDPSQPNRVGKCPFTMADRKTIEIMGKAMADPKSAEALKERKQYWAEYEQEQINERLRQRRSGESSSTLNQTNKSAAQQKLTSAQKVQKKSQLSIMTLRGGTLRDPKLPSKIEGFVRPQQKSTEVRPWGGSKETELFQREIRMKVREMKKQLRENLDDMFEKAIELKGMVMGGGEEDDYEEDDGNLIEEEEEEHVSIEEPLPEEQDNEEQNKVEQTM